LFDIYRIKNSKSDELRANLLLNILVEPEKMLQQPSDYAVSHFKYYSD
jgi:hypothetical protein